MTRWAPLILLAGAAGLLAGCGGREADQDVPVLRVGHVGHDHQTALYVACLNSERFRSGYGLWLEPIEPKKLYAIMDNGEKVGEVELFKAGGGSKMPTMMTQGHFEVGLGGVAPVMAFIDKGSPMKIIAPLHSKGDMLVVAPDNPATDWPSFVEWVRGRDEQVRIGYKNPLAVAKLIFQGALEHEKITHTGHPADTTAQVRMVLLKGERNLVPALQARTVDGYASNNPWCAIAESKGIGKTIADLNALPPGTWRDHPCCCVAATDDAIAQKAGAVTRFLELIIAATDTINAEPQIGYRAASEWIGTSLEVERKSMATSGYATVPDDTFYHGMEATWENMVRLGQLTGELKAVEATDLRRRVYDFSLLAKARAALARRKKAR